MVFFFRNTKIVIQRIRDDPSLLGALGASMSK
jgi:hypothetical protein